MEGRKVGDVQEKVLHVRNKVGDVQNKDAQEEVWQVDEKELKSRVLEVVASRAERMVEFLKSKEDSELFGETELELRDMTLELAGRVMEVTLDHRKKGGTKGAA